MQPMFLLFLVPVQERPPSVHVPPKPTPEVTMFDPLATDKQQPDSSTGSVALPLYPSAAADTGQAIQTSVDSNNTNYLLV